MRVLLHVCCGPCATMPVRALREEGHEVVGYYLNPNIHPSMEYMRRREAAKAMADHESLPMVWDDARYQPERFIKAVAKRHEERCEYCYISRLGLTARKAREEGYDGFCTSLLFSRRQDHALLRDVGERYPNFLYRDFRHLGPEGIAASKEMGLYRQQYCGCVYSEFERYQREFEALTQSG